MLTILFCAISALSYCQKENYVWLFGQHACLNFNTTPPTASYLGVQNGQEGHASIADPITGELLFNAFAGYLWDKNQTQIASGLGGGSGTYTQCHFFLFDPGDINRIYLFTRAATYTYTTIDRTLNGGLGDIIPGETDVLLASFTGEKQCGIYHSNCTDVWMVIGNSATGEFYAFLVTAGTVSTTPVISSPGITFGSYGQMKASHDGTKVAVSAGGTKFIILDFNQSTGILSNPVTVNASSLYGIEFSPDNNKLYTSTLTDLFQYDLSSMVPADIIASKVTLSTGYGRSPQLGPDGKIYCCRGQEFMGVIEFPNVAGAGCNYDPEGLTLAATTGSMYVLPNHVRGTCVVEEVNITPSGPVAFCQGESVTLTASDGPDPNYYVWSTGVTTNPITVNTAGTYWVYSEDTVSGAVDTAWITITVYSNPTVNLGYDISVCQGETVTLDAGAGYTYFWSDSSTNQTINATTTGQYSVTVTDGNGCTGSDAINVTINPNPVIDLGSNQAICNGESVTLDAGGGYTYHWSNSSVNQTITVTTAGQYSVTVTESNGCTGTDNVTVTLSSDPVVSLGSDLTLCQGQSAVLNASGGFSSYIWSDGSSSQTITVNSTGTFSVTVTNSSGCSGSDNVFVNVFPIPVTNAGTDQSICYGSSATLTASGGTSYTWNTGATSQSITVTP
ncbi:MAG: hypothetical protein KJ607_03875, partial [Bacteroidetes bacterium]|nr:hypothetical protein [Bacteroidota bacterium]